LTIKQLSLYSDKIEELFKFYTDKLGFRGNLSETQFALKTANNSEIVFNKSEEPHYYHFAFNIPTNKVYEAHKWLEDRVDTLPEPESGNEIIHFVDWNAHAVYFKDPAGNIVEFIARHDLDNTTTHHFSVRDVLSISEIGVPSKNVLQNFEKLHDHLWLQRYSGDFEKFCAAGDEEGLVILTNMDRDWYPTDIKSESCPFEAELEHLQKKAKLSYEGGEIEVIYSQ
jgi:catechol 2,3-dioxygenase-like lactoylglutathione lyase family enzyme